MNVLTISISVVTAKSVDSFQLAVSALKGERFRIY